MDDKANELKKRFWTNFVLTSIITVVPVIFGLLYMNRMPEQVAIHFDAAGNPNNYMSREIAAWLTPVLCLVVHVLCCIVYYVCMGKAKSDEEKKMMINYQWLIPVVSCGASFMVLAYALGKKINVMIFVLILMVAVIAICVLAALPVIMKSRKK